MSEYQYYEFMTVDRPLTRDQIAELRQLSTRADISSTRFVNEYHWGDFRGDPNVLIERYFDAHLYLANWGTHRLMFRLPASALELKTAELYCVCDEATVRAHGAYVIIDLQADDEAGEHDYYDGPSTLGSFISARAELAAGDHRLLYLAWLLSMQWVDLERDDQDLDEVEPPLPSGLGELTGSLQSVVEFLRIDTELLAVAAEGSPSAPRTVEKLLVAAAARRRDHENAVADGKRREYEQRMESLVQQGDKLWRRVDALIGSKKTTEYDIAVTVLKSLRDSARWAGTSDEFEARIRQIRAGYSNRPGLLRRLDDAEL